MTKAITLLILALILAGLSGIALAQEPEKDEIIFTTYYPAPYGVYNEFKANRVVVGEDLDTEDLDDGQLQVNESLILTPTSRPTTNLKKGQIYYDDDDDKIYYNPTKFSDGWKEFGGMGLQKVTFSDPNTYSKTHPHGLIGGVFLHTYRITTLPAEAIVFVARARCETKVTSPYSKKGTISLDSPNGALSLHIDKGAWIESGWKNFPTPSFPSWTASNYDITVRGGLDYNNLGTVSIKNLEVELIVGQAQ